MTKNVTSSSPKLLTFLQLKAHMIQAKKHITEDQNHNPTLQNTSKSTKLLFHLCMVSNYQTTVTPCFQKGYLFAREKQLGKLQNPYYRQKGYVEPSSNAAADVDRRKVDDDRD